MDFQMPLGLVDSWLVGYSRQYLRELTAQTTGNHPGEVSSQFLAISVQCKPTCHFFHGKNLKFVDFCRFLLFSPAVFCIPWIGPKVKQHEVLDITLPRQHIAAHQRPAREPNASWKSEKAGAKPLKLRVSVLTTYTTYQEYKLTLV